MAGHSELMGLVLAGGHSTRMGQDKGLMVYHGKAQREYLMEQLQPLCSRVFLSIRPEQETTLPEWIPRIPDENTYRGPFNGILSAHHAYPDAAWLVVACDLPMLGRAELNYLAARRNPESMATAFATRESGLPEPLAAIWEADGLRAAESYLQTAQSSCPRKFLIHSQTTLVTPEEDLWVANANEPGEYTAILEKMSGK